MIAPARRRASYEDVLGAPPNMVAEVIYGVLHTQPRPAIRHANASSLLGALIGNPFRLAIGGPVWQRVAVVRDDAAVRAEPFDAVELQLGSLWER